MTDNYAHYEEDNQYDFQPRQPISEVVMDGLVVLKIVKHCNDNIPTGVAGSLLGLDYDGVLEISYTYPLLGAKTLQEGENPSSDDIAGDEYQLMMMDMLEEVKVDNNCVGWYQSTNLGTICTNDLINDQYSYQSSDKLFTSTVVIIYDPILSKNGRLVLKAFRLSDKYMDMKRRNLNDFIPPEEILQELPIRIKNVGHVSAFLRCIQDTNKSEIDNDFNQLSLSSTDTYIEKYLEFLGNLMDEFVQEQQRFIQYSKGYSKNRVDHLKWLNRRVKENLERAEAGEEILSTRFEDSNLRPIPEAPPRTDALIELGQLTRYCDQINELVDSSLQKLVLTSQLSQS